MSVDYTDVAVALGRPADSFGVEEQAQIQYWINSARMLIRGRLGDLDLLDQEVLDYVVTEAVAAKATNPEGAVAETVDDYSYRLPEESQRVTIREDWWQMLSPRRRGRAFSVMPS